MGADKTFELPNSGNHCMDHERCMGVFGKALFGDGDPNNPGVVFSLALMNNRIKDLIEQTSRHRKEDRAKLDDVYDAIVGGIDKKGIKTLVVEHGEWIQKHDEKEERLSNKILNFFIPLCVALSTAGILYLVTALTYAGDLQRHSQYSVTENKK